MVQPKNVKAAICPTAICPDRKMSDRNMSRPQNVQPQYIQTAKCPNRKMYPTARGLFFRQMSDREMSRPQKVATADRRPHREIRPRSRTPRIPNKHKRATKRTNHDQLTTIATNQGQRPARRTPVLLARRTTVRP